MPEASYLPFWLGGLALVSVPLLHWLVLSRALAVSGRFSFLVDRVRHGAAEPAPDEAAMVEAIRAATLAQFGTDAVEAPPADMPESTVASTPKESAGSHAAFLVGLLLGGVVSTLLRGGISWSPSLTGTIWTDTFGSGAAGYAALFGGGLLVGFGTRMSGGCTSCHGLCGLSQRQPGSFVATCSFFGAGIVASFLLGAL
jgi:uncharacterized protein